MAVKSPIDYTEGIITFTCQHWLSLFEITKSYDTCYKWFDHLKTKGHYVKGYVIMPNHLHALIDFGISVKSIHTMVSNGKRLWHTANNCLSSLLHTAINAAPHGLCLMKQIQGL